jgi:hypothetical protein
VPVAKICRDIGELNRTFIVIQGVSSEDLPLTETHFSFLLSPTSVDLSDSSSEVMLSSVSASMPVLLSDSELELDEDSLDVWDSSVFDASAFEVVLVVLVFWASLFEAASDRAIFLALARASFLSAFYKWDNEMARSP